MLPESRFATAIFEPYVRVDIRPLLAALLFIVALRPACAQSADAAASPAPSPSPSPRGFAIGVDAHTTFISEGTRGPGYLAARRPRIRARLAALAVDAVRYVFECAADAWKRLGICGLFSSLVCDARSHVFGDARRGLRFSGSTTDAAYWGEPLFNTLNPHLGFQQLGFHIVFPTHAGQDDGTGFAASVLSGSVATNDGRVSGARRMV